MDFIQTSNKAVDLFGPGKHGFGAGNPTAGVLATFFSATWANDVQQEIVNVIEGAGIAIAPGTRNQLVAAIRALITSPFTGSNQLVAGSGYQVMPGADGARLILQWGSVVSNASGVATVTFPIAFTFGVFIVIGTHIGGDVAIVIEMGNARTRTGTKLLIRTPDLGTSIWSMNWFAVGV